MKHRFEVLDGWRGIAAVMVALFHLIINTHLRNAGIVANAGAFVDFFFVLSGFVITHAYMDELQNGMPLGVFVVRRLGRLWPLHMAILAVLVLREIAVFALSTRGLIPQQPVFSDGTGLWQLLSNIFFLQAVGIDHTHSWNGPSWSISTEFWTYIIFAVLCILLRKNVVAAVCAAVALISAILVWIYSPTYMATSFEFGMLRCLYGFFVGHITYRVWTARRGGITNPVLVEIATLLLVVFYVSVTPLVPPNAWTMIAPLVFAIAVWVFAFEAGPISKLMRNRVILALGAWSYSIYMIHDFIAFTVGKFVNGCAVGEAEASSVYRMTCLALFPASLFSNPWFLDVVAVVYLCIVIAISAAAFKFIEVPGRNYFNKVSSRLYRKPAIGSVVASAQESS